MSQFPGDLSSQILAGDLVLDSPTREELEAILQANTQAAVDESGGTVYAGGTPNFDETTGTYTGGQTGTGGIGTLDPGVYVPSVTQQNVSMDPIMQQLLFGLGGQPGFIQGAMQAAQNTFYGPDGTPIVYQQPVAGLSPGQLAAINLAQQNVGAIQPYLQAAQSA